MAIDGSEILYVTGVYDGSLAAVPQQTTTGAIAALGGNISGNVTIGNLTATTGNITTLAGTTGNLTTVNSTTVVATTGNLTTVNSTTVNGTTVIGTTGNLTTVNSTTLNGTTGVLTTGNITTANITTANVGTGNITALSVMPTLPVAAPAAAGNSQGTATALSLGMNFVTGADGTTGVILPGTATGKVVEVFNTAAADLDVYPASGGAINAIAANTAITMAANTSARFVGSAAGQWYTDPRVPS